VDSPAARLASLRARLGLSQEQLARELGVSFATVNRWETGHTRMSPRAARALAEFEARGAAGPPAAPEPVGRLPSAAMAPETLPVAQSSFVGRADELAELCALLAQSRLITLIGPGGVGKTRLAIEAIRRQPAAADVAFIPLEPVRQPELLMSAVAFGLRVRDQPGMTLQASVEAALHTMPRLVVLDGAEHLRAEVAELVSRLLSSVPGVRIVVTSRLLLGAPGEVCWTVPPLTCPSAAAPVSDIASSDAVRLFMARAGERLPGFSSADVAPHAIAELCRRLDSLPLAIELIAGWVGTLSVHEILQQQAVLLDQEVFEDGSPGGRGLADVMRASYDLLRPEERALLPVLSVFAGAFTLDDAKAVSGAGPALPRTIRGLVDSSWLAVTHGGQHNRFTMLATMRAFAAALLDEQGDGPVLRARHAAHFAELARSSEPGLSGPDEAGWNTRLEAAVADFGLAFGWAEESGGIDLGLDLGASLWRWWLRSGRLTVGRDWLGRFLARAGQRRDERTGSAFCAAAILAAENGDYREAIRQGQLSLAIFEQLDLPARTALAATVLGSAHRYLGDSAAARRSFERALDLRQRTGDRQGVSAAMNNLALLEGDDGNLGRARELFEQTLAIKRQLGERQSVAVGLCNLADVLIKTGRLDAATSSLAEAAGLAADVGNPQLIGTVHCNQGDVAARQQHWPEAAEHYRAAMVAHQQVGHTNDAVLAMIGLGRADFKLGRADEANRLLRDAEVIAEQLASPQRLAEVRAALAEVGAKVSGVLPDGLTARQAEVLRLLAAGLSNKQIASELYLSPATVERHLATIYRKLNLTGRVEATRYAVRTGLAGPAR
jgi:non-specific serine/threonine protein kinase